MKEENLEGKSYSWNCNESNLLHIRAKVKNVTLSKQDCFIYTETNHEAIVCIDSLGYVITVDLWVHFGLSNGYYEKELWYNINKKNVLPISVWLSTTQRID